MAADIAAIARAPHRAHEIDLKVGADTLDDLVWALRTISTELQRGQLSRGCSGSPSAGWTHEYRHDPEMTHDRYFADVDAWLDRDHLLSEEEGK